VTDLAKKCPGCGDLGVQQVVNEFGDPEWWGEGWKDEDQDPVYICFCPFCGRELQDPATTPARMSLTRAAKQLMGRREDNMRVVGRHRDWWRELYTAEPCVHGVDLYEPCALCLRDIKENIGQ